VNAQIEFLLTDAVRRAGRRTTQDTAPTAAPGADDDTANEE
jgi:hypothetical protein